MKTRHFCSDNEVMQLVAAFESGQLPAAEFKHTAHIAVGLAYLAEAPLVEATERMRRSLAQFLQHHNETGYHETLTVFWMKLLRHLAAVRHSELPAVGANQCSNRDTRVQMAGGSSLLEGCRYLCNRPPDVG